MGVRGGEQSSGARDSVVGRAGYWALGIRDRFGCSFTVFGTYLATRAGGRVGAAVWRTILSFGGDVVYPAPDLPLVSLVVEIDIMGHM